jgi:hypothetical protein
MWENILRGTDQDRALQNGAALTVAVSEDVVRSTVSSPATKTPCIIKADNVYYMCGFVDYNSGVSL